jgi:hypothetical protein
MNPLGQRGCWNRPANLRAHAASPPEFLPRSTAATTGHGRPGATSWRNKFRGTLVVSTS